MAQVDTEIVPTGKLRVGINGSNATLYAHAADGSASGISADLGKFIAENWARPSNPWSTRVRRLTQQALAKANGTSLSPAEIMPLPSTRRTAP